MYKNYDLSKLKWFFNGTEQTKLKSLSVEREESFNIPSSSNSEEKTITTSVSYPIGEGDETTSASVSKKVKVRKYQQRYYLYVFSSKERWEEDIVCYKDIFLLAVANSKQKGNVKYNVEFVVNNKKVPIGVTEKWEKIDYPFVGTISKRINDVVKADNSEYGYQQIKNVFSGEINTLYPDRDGVISVYESYLNNPNTYFLINGIRKKPSITATYLGGSNTDNFYKDFNRRLEGIGVEYDA